MNCFRGKIHLVMTVMALNDNRDRLLNDNGDLNDDRMRDWYGVRNWMFDLKNEKYQNRLITIIKRKKR